MALRLSLLLAILLVSFCTNAQTSFHKHALLVSVSEGVTGSRFRTMDGTSSNNDGRSVVTTGERDPLTIEYGVSNRLGIGLNMGLDILHVSPTIYGISGTKENLTTYMSEFTFDLNYHILVNQKTDIAAFISAGISGVNFEQKVGDQQLKYSASGGIVRSGVKAKYYMFRRLGIMAMLSGFSATCLPDDQTKNNLPQNYTTTLRGWALEFGPCFRFF